MTIDIQVLASSITTKVFCPPLHTLAGFNVFYDVVPQHREVLIKKLRTPLQIADSPAGRVSPLSFLNDALPSVATLKPKRPHEVIVHVDTNGFRAATLFTPEFGTVEESGRQIYNIQRVSLCGGLEAFSSIFLDEEDQVLYHPPPKIERRGVFGCSSVLTYPLTAIYPGHYSVAFVLKTLASGGRGIA